MKKIIQFSLSFFIVQPLLASTEMLVKMERPMDGQVKKLFDHLEEVRSDVVVINSDQIKELKTYTKIIHIEPNHKIIPYNTPNDLSLLQWGIFNDAASGVDANVVEAWQMATGSKKVVVAVTDTGMDIHHEDLKDNLWINKKEMNGQEGVDDDGNGQVDDFYGWNFAGNNNNLTDYKRHGTHVAGIIGAKGDNDTGLVGVNWDVSLMPINFFHRNKDTKVSDAIKAIDYAIDNGAHIINASWGAPHNEIKKEEFKLLSEAIERAKAKNIVFVAAAGNSGIDNDNQGHIPASLNNTNIISVGAITRFGWMPSFSNYGKTSVDIFAPGSVIRSTLPGDYYGNLNGTSMAAPFISGVIALMLSKKPNLKPEEIVRKLLNSCAPNNNLVEACRCQGHIDAALAVQ